MKKLKLITTKATALSIAAILAVTGLTACGSKTTSESSSKKEASVDSENNTIKFAIQPGTIRTAIVILANELGYYKEEGVNVDRTFYRMDSKTQRSSRTDRKCDQSDSTAGIYALCGSGDAYI